MTYEAVCRMINVWQALGLKRAVISAGSRSAPLALAFARCPDIEVTVANDERAAAFMALGMGQALKQPVALVCTSGSAGLNYSPAVAEAYYQEVGLLVCTADRPSEWIDQWDGQTLRQDRLFADRVVATFNMPQSVDYPDFDWHVNRLANEAWLAATGQLGGSYGLTKGPVHLNFPFREPFYPDPDQGWIASEERTYQVIQPTPLLGKYLAHDLVNLWLNTERKLVVIGQQPMDPDLNNVLYAAQHYASAPLVADIISNSSQVEGAINYADLILMRNRPDLEPELLVTVGKSIISKNLKLALRSWRPKYHIHIEPTGYVPDVYQSVTHLLRTSPQEFFTRVGEQSFFSGLADSKNDYYKAWEAANKEASMLKTQFISSSAQLSDLIAVQQVIDALPDRANLHLANSMSVRYANLVGLKPKHINRVYANRGTSGIDGCNSTAVGFAKATSDELTLLITGDVGFFYDRNAFWQQHLPQNLKVLLLNNSGGNIFRMIDGPAKQPELSELFETWQEHNASSLADQAGAAYKPVHQLSDLSEAIKWLYSETGLAILEVFTDPEQNAVVFSAFKKAIKAGA